MSDRTSSYFSEIGGDFKGIQRDISGGVISQYIITQKSGIEIRNQRLITGSPYLGLRKFEKYQRFWIRPLNPLPPLPPLGKGGILGNFEPSSPQSWGGRGAAFGTFQITSKEV